MTQKKTKQKTNRRFKPGSHSSPPKFCYLWIWIVLFFIAVQYVSSSGLLRPKFDYGNFTNSASSRARFRRDTTKLDNAVRNLGHLARVTNGIALEIGLVDGSIKPGEAVSELLLMGDLQLDDIINLNHDSIEKVLTAMSQKIQTNKKVEKLEQRLMRMEDVREISSNLLDLKKIPGLKEFETSFNAVKGLAKHKATVAAKQSEVHIWASTLDYLGGQTKTGLTDDNRDDIAVKFSSIAIAIDKLKAFQTSLDPAKKLIEEGKKMSDNVKFIDYLATENNFRTSEAVDYTTLTPLLLKSFDKVNEDFQAASDSQKEFESILKLVQSRSPLHRQTFKHTAGFPRGSDDLKDLEQSIEDPSIISRISNGESVKTDLKAAFESFKNLEKEIGVISSDWKGLEAQYKSVNDVVSNVIELGKLSGVSQSISGAVDALVACDKGKYPTSTLDETLAESINALSNKVGGLGSFGYLNDFSNLDSLKKEIDTRNQPPEKVTEIITNVFNKWKTDETLKTFIANVKKLDEDLKYFLDFLNEDPTKEDKLATVTKHLKDIDQPDYTTFLKCVNEIQVKGFPVRQMIQFIQESKAVSVPQDAKDAITKVIQSGTSLTNAQSLAGKFKGDGKFTPKIEVFKSSFEKENYEEVSRKLGMGVQGLAAILKVRTATIDDLVKMTDKILDAAKTDGLSPEHQKSLQQLREVQSVLNSIDTFLQTSKGLQAFRRKRNAGFESFQEIFKDAANVQGATIVMKSLREAIGKVNIVGPKAAGVTNGLDTLATLDLDFAKFNMADAVSSLISMDKFFKKYIALLSGAPGPGNLVTTKPGQKGPSASADSLVGGKAKEEGGIETWIIIVGVIGLILLIIVIVVLAKCCWRKPKPPPKVIPDPDVPPLPPVPSDPLLNPLPNPPPNPAPDVVNPDVPQPPIPPQENLHADEDVRINNDYPAARYVPRVDREDGAGAPPAAINGPNGAGEAEGQENAGLNAGGQEGDHGRVENEAAPDVAQNAGGQQNAAGGQAGAGPVVEGQGGHQPADVQGAGGQADAAGGPAGNGQGADPSAEGQRAVGPNGAAPVVGGPSRQGEKPLLEDKTQEDETPKIKIGNQDDFHLPYNLAADIFKYGLRRKKKTPAAYLGDEMAKRKTDYETKADLKNSEQLNQNERRGTVYFDRNYMAKIEGFPDNSIDCTKVSKKTYISQHPIGPEEAGKTSTQDKHWKNVYENGIQIIVQVQDETGTLPPYYPKAVNDELPVGDYVIKNVKTSTVKGCTVRELECLDTKSKTPKTVHHIEYTGWTKSHVPNEQELLDIIELARSYDHEETKLFHCSDGLHESIILAAIDLGIELQSLGQFPLIDDVILPFLRTRYGCVVSPQEMLLIVLAITKAQMKQKDVGYCPSYSVLKYIYEKMQANNYYDRILSETNSKEFLINEFKQMEARCAKDKSEWEAANPGKEICLDEINFAKYIKDVEEKPEKNTKQSRVKKSKDGTKGGQKQPKTKTTTKAKKNKSKDHNRHSRSSDGKKNIPNNNKPGPSHAGKKPEIGKKSKDLSGSQQKKPKEPQQKKEVAPKLDEDGDEGSPSSTKKYNQPKKHHVARPPPPTGNSKKKKSKGK